MPNPLPNDPALSSPLPWDGQPYSAKRHGVAIANCASEPVQTPGCVQAHGVMLVLRAADLTIVQASDNAMRWLGQSAEELLGKSVAIVLGDEGCAQLVATLDRERTEENPLYLFTLPTHAAGLALDVIVHTMDGVVVVELEAQPVRSKETADVYGPLRASVARLQTSATLRDFCDSVAKEVRAITGFDRVMVYRFHEDAHGEVFAESRRDDLAPWLGMHYPAEDIPKPARDVFVRTWVRPVADACAELSELVPLANPDTGKPLVMTHCALRGPSIMYTEYLTNMGVRASFTLSLRRDGELWGLVACHQVSDPVFVPYATRAACELFAQVASLQLKSAEDRDHIDYRLRLDDVHHRVAANAARANDLRAMTDASPALLDGIDATGAAILHRGRWWRMGDTPSDSDLDQLAAWLCERPELLDAPRVYATDALGRVYPQGKALAHVASGVLAAALSTTQPSLVLWLRSETITNVTWGGRPDDKPTVLGPHGPRLTPRTSFEIFIESVRDRSLPWKSVEIEAAGRLRGLLLELVFDQAGRLADLNADLTRSNDDLDAFAYVASHDLKEPLRGIHKYAHHLLTDASLSEDKRVMVASLARLTLRMDSLIESLLHLARIGRSTFDIGPVDLGELLSDALEVVEARRTESHTDLVVPRPLPTATCDRVGVREIFVNLLSNAMKYSDKPRRRIEVGYLAPGEVGVRGAGPEGAARATIYFVRDDGIGIHPRHHEQVFQIFRRLHGREEYGGGTGAGLAIVKKLIERHRGCIWIDSVPRAGTTVFFTLEEVS